MNNTLLKKMSILKNVTSYDYRAIQDLIKNNFDFLEIKTYEMFNYVLEMRLNACKDPKEFFSNFKNYITYDRYLSLNIKYSKKEINITIYVYDQSFNYSNRDYMSEKKFHVEYKVKNNVLRILGLFKDSIDAKFKFYLEDKYEEYLKKEKNKWMGVFAKTILKDIK